MCAGAAVKVVTVVVAVSAFLAECSPSGAARPHEGSTMPADTVVEELRVDVDDLFDPGPPAFRQRDPLPSCGTVELTQGEQTPADAIACVDGAGAAGAELVVTAPTVEGDPVTTYFRALPGGGIEMFVDLSEDMFAGERSSWLHVSCPLATSIQTARGANCRSDER
ncbi:hypothetical protein [Microbacterium sp. zg.B185]|nr:hypothetical protein [Microbacterium sp. zg.B185]MCR2811068.1 hypothetical protein [Microbacterium sp. zg.B185]